MTFIKFPLILSFFFPPVFGLCWWITDHVQLTLALLTFVLFFFFNCLYCISDSESCPMAIIWQHNSHDVSDRPRLTVNSCLYWVCNDARSAAVFNSWAAAIRRINMEKYKQTSRGESGGVMWWQSPRKQLEAAVNGPLSVSVFQSTPLTLLLFRDTVITPSLPPADILFAHLYFPPVLPNFSHCGLARSQIFQPSFSS